MNEPIYSMKQFRNNYIHTSNCSVYMYSGRFEHLVYARWFVVIRIPWASPVVAPFQFVT